MPFLTAAALREKAAAPQLKVEDISLYDMALEKKNAEGVTRATFCWHVGNLSAHTRENLLEELGNHYEKMGFKVHLNRTKEIALRGGEVETLPPTLDIDWSSPG